MPEETKDYSIKEYILFKLDRTIAIVGLVVLGLWALYKVSPETVQIAMAVVGGLVGYVGGRSASK